jgi:Domain of unknown function (DUF4157)/A nuclease family of the HNH/ENDO VII superfamily with conserved AHH
MSEATRVEAKASGAKKENVASQKQKTDLPQSISSPAEQIMFLQRTIGNQAVGRLIRSGALKAKIDEPNDIHEQKANRVAHHVLNTSDPVVENSIQRTISPEEKKDQTLQTRPLADSITPVVQRQMVKDREEETEPIQAKSAGSRDNNFEEGADIETQINLSKGHGSPLPDPVRTYMEPRFGVDFSQVRVHTDSDAIQMNRDIKARAFTHDTNIYFGAGHSTTNLELTAHELTHVVQQTSGHAALTQRASAVQSQPKDTASEGKKRMYRTRDGEFVELPPDMTVAEAARLEAEGIAAEKKLGKRPPPKPVSDVKKQASKEEKEGKPKPKGKGKGKSKGKSKGKVARKGGGAAMLEAVGHSEVAQYLTKRGASVLIKGMGRLQKLKQNEQTHDNAAEKLKQSEKAVFTPPSEGQSQSNAAQVNAVSAKPVPTVDEKRAKKKLQESLIENIPETIEDVDNFKRDKKAQRMGADVMKVVQGDKNAVISTFGDMEHTPPPIPPKHTPEALPPKEIAPHTANMYLGRNAIAPLQKEHTDLSNYTGEAENKLKEEDITQEQLDMVDSGDLAEANKEKKGMEKTAKSEPLAVQKFAQQETKKVEKDLRQEEKKQRNELKVKRKASLGATLKQQKGTKTAIEKQRDEVASKINGIYRSAQDKVKKKLTDLEKNSMKRFDEGNNKATKKFEDNVKREINAYKKKRYSGWFGWTKKAKDWILGMDKLPKVKAIFESNRTTFVNTINKLVENITTDNKRVVQECKDELANARVEIKEFVDKLGPALKDIGKKAAEEMNNKLDDLDQFVAKKEQELQYKLKDKQQAAIKTIDEKIEKMKEAMSGALSKLGKLLLNAAKKFFSWALQKFGYSLEKIDGIINKGAAVLKAIFTKPVKFVKNLVSAAGTGFKNFGKNFLKHLKNAVFAWLTGSLVGIILPERWDLKGIMSVVFQMLGITYQNIRSHIVKLIPEPVVKTMETTFTLVKNLITKGPMAVWEQLKGMAESIKNTFVNAIKDWIKWKVVEEAIKTILSMLIPGAGIVRAIVGIYDTIVFFIQKAKDIMQMLGNFLGSIAQIAAGNISSAAEALENGLARGLKLVIEFLAKFLHLSGITQKIRDVIKKIRGKVDNVIAKVAKWIVAKAKKVLGKLTGKGKEKKPDGRTDKQKKADLHKGVAEAKSLLDNKKLSSEQIKKKLPSIQSKYKMNVLELVTDSKKDLQEIYHIHGTINPEENSGKVEKDTGEWPVKVGDNIKTKSSYRIEKVLALTPESITYTQSDKKDAAPVTQPRQYFMMDWKENKAYKTGELSAAEERAKLEAFFPRQPKVVDAIMDRGKLRKQILASSSEHAHHIIPIEILKKHRSIQKLVQEGGFDFNGTINGVLLEEGFHGSHSAYNAYIYNCITRWVNKNGSRPVKDIKSYVVDQLIKKLKSLIQDAKKQFHKKGTTLNDYFKKLL